MWRLITDLPAAPVAVEIFYGGLKVLTDEYGNEQSLLVEPYRDARRAVGYFDGGTFRDNWTGHDLLTLWSSAEHKPTHWRELPPVPEI